MFDQPCSGDPYYRDVNGEIIDYGAEFHRKQYEETLKKQEEDAKPVRYALFAMIWFLVIFGFGNVIIGFCNFFFGK